MTQKSLLQTVQQICAEISAPSPSQVLSSTDTNIAKILAFVVAACDDLTYEFDWNVLQVSYSFNTVNGQESYPWPSDYQRSMQGTFFDATNRWPLKIVTPTQWEIINIWNVTASPFERLRVFQNEMWFFPVPASTYTFVFDYISNYYINDTTTGNNKGTFTSDADIILFDYRLVIYLVKCKYLQSIGEDTTAALAEYKRILEFAKGQDLPSQRLSLIPSLPRLLGTDNVPDASWQTGT